MKVYYRFSKISRGTAIYELNIHYQSYIIDVFFFSRNLPIKRLTRDRPLDYFKVKRNRFDLCVSKVENRTHVSNRDILIENPNQKLLTYLVKKAKPYSHSIKLTEREVEMIITKFLKAYE